MFCSKCGHKVERDEKFCAGCGSQVSFSNNSFQHRNRNFDTKSSTAYVPQNQKFNYARQNSTSEIELSFFEGSKLIDTTKLIKKNKNNRITFGRDAEEDICIKTTNNVLSRHHGYFEKKPDGWYICDDGSTNGFIVNNVKKKSHRLSIGDVIIIGSIKDARLNNVILVGETNKRWDIYPVEARNVVTLGRGSDNDISFSMPFISSHHAKIHKEGDKWFLLDLGSFNGTYVNGVRVDKSVQILPGSVITLALFSFVFSGSAIIYSTERSGVEIFSKNLTQIRKTKNGSRITNDNISLHINKGEFVAIVGGSGAGKSTLLNELNGIDFAAKGNVYYDGIDLYSNYEKMKNMIGYVPQQDIIYDNLRLIDMLVYAAELRMTPDTTKEERINRAKTVINMLDLSNETNSMIKNLSGGQKKRASIAVELLSDPKLLFLDEPTSGLDPGIEKSLMQTLYKMAMEGRTIVLVTHTTQNLDLCSKVVFLAPGGKLAFSGPPSAAREFFDVEDYVSIFEKLAANPQLAANNFARSKYNENINIPNTKNPIISKKVPSFFRQLSTLSRRYIKLLLNDKIRTILLLLQAPVLAGLICVVAGNDCFSICENTKSCLFAMCCAAFWVGILDSIQEICKERSILKREYSSGLRIGSYLASKVIVLSILCLIQSVLLTSIFILFCGTPSCDALFVSTCLELYITMFLLVDSAMCLGLWVSAMFKNPDRAIAMAPILIMPQVLFSGLIFELKGVAEKISYFVNCKWGMEALGSTSDINSLDLSIYGREIDIPASKTTVQNMEVDVPATTKTIDENMYPHDVEDAYIHSFQHLMCDWGILLAFCCVTVILCFISLYRSLKK